MFQGSSRGENIVGTFELHPITEGVSPLSYGAGSGITEFPEEANIFGYLSVETYLDLNDDYTHGFVEPTSVPALCVGRLFLLEMKYVAQGATADR